MKPYLLQIVSAVSAALLFFHPAPAAADPIELGRLECFIDAGTGFLIGSSKDVSCVFTAENVEWGQDNYFGVINRLGIDIGSTEEGYMSWLVIAITGREWEPGILSGNYIGAGASASVALGLGANALVGGFGKAIALQPFSIQTQTGINFAAGIAELELRSIQSGE